MSESFTKELVQRMTRNLLDVQILRLIQAQPMWGYKIKKEVTTKFGLTLRHGALYPLLNTLAKKSFLTSREQKRRGRTIKVYSITEKGEKYLQSYENALREQLKG